MRETSGPGHSGEVEGGTPIDASGSRSFFSAIRDEDKGWMREALAEARAAAKAGEVPASTSRLTSSKG